MNKMLYTSVCAIICAFQEAGAQSLQPFPASLTIRVSDQEGFPIKEADAGATFTNFDIVKARLTYIARHALTNNEGKVTATAETLDNRIYYAAEKAGYYKTTGLKYEFQGKKDGRWLPWNPIVEVVLKRIVNPIPMFAKHIETKMPEEAWPVGFDLQAGDWVAPYGKGTVKDFIFTVKRTITSDRDYRVTLQLAFSNKSDGLLVLRDVKNDGSELLLPRNAAETGYDDERTWNYGRAPSESGRDIVSKPSDVPAYFFRIRTVQDEQGRIKSALYGKIHGDFKLYLGLKAPSAGFGFTYYLNPTPNDRNVEFDPKSNLFTGLNWEESVREP